MASAMIHLAVAKRVNEELKLKENEFFLGAVAPDVSKMVGSSRAKSHFVIPNTDIPDIGLFLAKYKDVIGNPFELGYLVHLLTDVLWFKDFLPNYVDDKNFLTDRNNNTVYVTEEEYKKIIYNDYSSLNSEILDYYDMDLSTFYNELNLPVSHIEEVPTEYLPYVLEKIGNICTTTSDYKYILDIENIVHFIEYASIYCLDELQKIK